MCSRHDANLYYADTHTLCKKMMSLSESLSPVTGSIMSFLINFSTHSWVTTAPLDTRQCYCYQSFSIRSFLCGNLWQPGLMRWSNSPFILTVTKVTWETKKYFLSKHVIKTWLYWVAHCDISVLGVNQ